LFVLINYNENEQTLLIRLWLVVKLERNATICSCTSSLRIFDSSPDGLVDPEEEPSFTFCGHEIAPGTTFYSRLLTLDEHLLLQIIHGEASSKGFMGEYKFSSKDNYMIDGVEIARLQL
ncbi:hypothetical protein COOONC_16282, partial [Cooperia oncophora]